MSSPTTNRNIPRIHREDMPLVQDLVQAAYVVMMSWEREFDYDPELIRKTLKSKTLYVHVPGYHYLKQVFDQHICDSQHEVSREEYVVKPDELKVFFECDIYMVNAFGEVPEIDEESLSFSYMALSVLPTEELQNLRDLIERIQILLSSRILYKDFNAAFRVLSYIPSQNFLNLESNFDISKLNTPRGWKLLAMYRSTTDLSFFEDENSQNFLIADLYKWLITINDRIFSILKPSHKLENDTRYLANCKVPSSSTGKWITQFLIARFVVVWTTCQTDHLDLIDELAVKMFLGTMEDSQLVYKTSRFESLESYFKLRKIFFDLLVAPTFVFDGKDLLEPTKEIRVFEKLALSVDHVTNSQLLVAPEDLDIGDKPFWSAKFRKVGPESKQETEYRQRCERFYRLSQLEWTITRETQITKGLYQVETEVAETKARDLYRYDLNFCFPNDKLFKMAVLPLLSERVIWNDDIQVYFQAIEFLYQVSLETMSLICSVSD